MTIRGAQEMYSDNIWGTGDAGTHLRRMASCQALQPALAEIYLPPAMIDFGQFGERAIHS